MQTADHVRPDPIEPLKAAVLESGADLPEGLLESVLSLERDATEQNAERLTVQANLRVLIEAIARDGS